MLRTGGPLRFAPPTAPLRGPPSSPPNRAMPIARLQSSVDETWGQRQGVKVAEIGDHQASLFALHREVMRDTVGFARGAIALQREDGALSDESIHPVKTVGSSADLMLLIQASSTSLNWRRRGATRVIFLKSDTRMLRA